MAEYTAKNILKSAFEYAINITLRSYANHFPQEFLQEVQTFANDAIQSLCIIYNIKDEMTFPYEDMDFDAILPQLAINNLKAVGDEYGGMVSEYANYKSSMFQAANELMAVVYKMNVLLNNNNGDLSSSMGMMYRSATEVARNIGDEDRWIEEYNNFRGSFSDSEDVPMKDHIRLMDFTAAAMFSRKEGIPYYVSQTGTMSIDAVIRDYQNRIETSNILGE